MGDSLFVDLLHRTNMLSLRVASVLLLALLPLVNLLAIDTSAENSLPASREASQEEGWFDGWWGGDEDALPASQEKALPVPAEEALQSSAEVDLPASAEDDLPPLPAVPEIDPPASAENALPDDAADSVEAVDDEVHPPADLNAITDLDDVNDGLDDSRIDTVLSRHREALVNDESVVTAGGIPTWSIACRTFVENLSRWPLQNPFTIVESGVVGTPPIEMSPGLKAAIRAWKSDYVPFGTAGVVTYTVPAPTPFKIHALWSTPYSHYMYPNVVAVAISGVDAEADFDALYDGEGLAGVAEGPGSVERCNDLVCVRGTIDDSYHTTNLIQVIPRNIRDFFPLN